MHKKFILTSLVIFTSLISGVCLSVQAKELEFAQVSDVHYSLNDEEMDKYLFFLSASIRKNSPDFIVFLGDNVEKSVEEDVIGFMRAVYSLKTPYYLVFGNNDAHRVRGLEKEEYLDIVSAFNHNQNSKDKYYYFKPNGDIVCAVIDATPDFAPSKHGEISDEQLVWLENLLKKYPKRLFLIFQHCPLIPPRDDYNLSFLDSEKYKQLLKNYKNIVLVSSGHYHQESVKKDENGVRHISAPAFKDMPHSYQIIKIIYDENSYKSPENVQVEVTNIKV